MFWSVFVEIRSNSVIQLFENQHAKNKNTSISPFVSKDRIFVIWQKKKSRIDGHRVNFPFCDFESGVRNVIKSVCDGEFSRAFVISSLYGKPTFILLNLTTCRNKLKKKKFTWDYKIGISFVTLESLRSQYSR